MNTKETTTNRPNHVALGTDREGAISVTNDRMLKNDGVMNLNAGMYDWKDLTGPVGRNLTLRQGSHEVNRWLHDQATENGLIQSDVMRPDG